MIKHFARTATLVFLTLPWTGCIRPKPVEPTVSTEALWAECAICHGTKEMQRGPIIDGMPAWAVEQQLNKFSTGIRGSNPKNRSEALMGAAIAKITTPEELKRLAAYISALPPRDHLTIVKGDAVAGQALYQTRCASCHGPQAKGNPLLFAPPLDTLEDWFVAEQLRKFAGGRRGIHPNDIQGQLMAAASKDLTQTQIRNLAVWIANQNPSNAEQK
jgi:cytochrome c553